MRPTRRQVLAALAAALVMFVWGGLAHMVLLQGVGFSRLPEEARTLDALEATVAAEGLYFFPGIDLRGDPSPRERADWQARARRGPTGFLIYHPRGSDPAAPAKLLIQLVSHLLAGALAAFVGSRARGSELVRAAVVASIGAGGLATISTIYWNWYGYPDAFFIAQCVDQLVGWSLAGLVVARLVPADAPTHVDAR